jgi:hypothetical protein
MLAEEPSYGDSVSFALSGSPWTRLLNIQQNGNVGIGTMPGSLLQIGPDLSFQSNWPTIGFNVNAASNKYITSNYGASIQENYTSGYLALTSYASGTAGNTPVGGANLILLSNGNVGIGTTTPTNILSLSGSASQTFWMERNPTGGTAGNSLTVESSGAASGGTNLNGGNLVLSSGTSTGSGTSNIQFNVFPGTAGSTTDNTATTAMTILGNGNIGIGTTVSGGPVTGEPASSARLAARCWRSSSSPHYAAL